KTYALLRNLVEPEKQKDRSFQTLTVILEKQLNPKPLDISERFRFRNRNQIKEESGGISCPAEESIKEL
ncbi:hypothetical protein AVEN_19490-1, partial [Araneus ventricosus]